MSKTEASPLRYVLQDHGWGSEHSSRNELGRYHAAEQKSAMPHPVIELAAGMDDFSDGIYRLAQSPGLQEHMEPRDVPGFRFGHFCLIPARRLLLDGDRPVPIGSRAMDLLIALTAQSRQLISKQQLMKQAWPDVTVDESNLKVQISALRRVLGDDQASRQYIVTIPGRGYVFVARVTQHNPSFDRAVQDSTKACYSDLSAGE